MGSQTPPEKPPVLITPPSNTLGQWHTMFQAEQALQQRPVGAGTSPPAVQERRQRIRSFFAPALLERLEKGLFVPERQGKLNTTKPELVGFPSPPLPLSEGVNAAVGAGLVPARRQAYDTHESPALSLKEEGADQRRESLLAITKKSIRLQPKVFSQRKTQLLEAAQFLNMPHAKTVMVSGAQGMGKLSFLRALSELLDNRFAEMIWLEIPAYADSVALGRLLLKSLYHLSQHRHPPAGGAVAPLEAIAPQDWEAAKTQVERQALFKKLTPHLTAISGTPVVIVLNGMEALANAHGLIEAPVLLEILDYLGTFPHTRMAFGGTHDITASLTISPTAVKHIVLSPVDNRAPWQGEAVQQYLKLSDLKIKNTHSHETGWNLGFPLPTPPLKGGGEKEFPIEDIVHAVQDRLDGYGGDVSNVLTVLSVHRHALPFGSLCTILGVSPKALSMALKDATLKPLLRFGTNPTPLLEALMSREHVTDDQRSILQPLHVDTYRAIKEAAYLATSPTLLGYWHERIAHYLSNQAGKAVDARQLPLSSSLALEQEARYHLEQSKALHFAPSPQDNVQQGTLVSHLKPRTNTPPTKGKPAGLPLPASRHASRPDRLLEKEEGVQIKKAAPSMNTSTVKQPSAASVISPKSHVHALLDLARLQIQHNQGKPLRETLAQLDALTHHFTSDEDAQYRLISATVFQEDGHYDHAIKHLKPLFVAFKTHRLQDDVSLGILNRLSALVVADVSLFETHGIHDVLDGYFKNATMYTQLFATEKSKVLAKPLKNEAATFSIWAQALDAWGRQLVKHESHLADGLEKLKQAVALYSSTGANVSASMTLHRMAKLFITRGKLDKALLCIEQAEQMDTLHSHSVQQWRTQKEKALLLFETGHQKEAMQLMKAVYADARTAENKEWQAIALFGMGELALDAVNGVEWAVSCMDKALAFGKDTLGERRYHMFIARRKQVSPYERTTLSPNKSVSQSVRGQSVPSATARPRPRRTV